MKHSIVIGGDILPWSNNIKKFEKGESLTLFSRDIHDLFSNADYSIVNLEGPLTSATQAQHKIGPTIKGSIESVNALVQLGVKSVALANNHITDFQNQGVEETLDVLRQSGVDYVGVGKFDDIKKYISFKLGNKKICIYNVSECFFNQPSKDNYGVNLYDEYFVCQEIKNLKATHDYLIVIYHGGAEYFQYPTPQTRTRFHRMADCGADFITAQHTHCIGCEENYNGSYLLYGQGNFCFAKQSDREEICRQGLVSELVFIDDDITIHNHCVEMQNNGSLVYRGDDFLSELKERSRNVDNGDYIEDRFRKLKPYRIVEKYLLADKGRLSMVERFLKRLNHAAYKKYMLNSYSLDDIERHYFVLTSDRAREDVLYMWQGIQKKYIK